MRGRVSLRHVELGHVDCVSDCMFLSQDIRSLDDFVSLPYVVNFQLCLLVQQSQTFATYRRAGTLRTYFCTTATEPCRHMFTRHTLGGTAPAECDQWSSERCCSSNSLSHVY